MTHQNLGLGKCWKLFWATLTRIEHFCHHLLKFTSQGVVTCFPVSQLYSECWAPYQLSNMCSFSSSVSKNKRLCPFRAVRTASKTSTAPSRTATYFWTSKHLQTVGINCPKVFQETQRGFHFPGQSKRLTRIFLAEEMGNMSKGNLRGITWGIRRVMGIYSPTFAPLLQLLATRLSPSGEPCHYPRKKHVAALFFVPAFYYIPC